MIAYIFWHSPSPATNRALYEAELSAFHQVLASQRPEGYISSTSFGVSGLCWVDGDGAYEDWYLLRDFASLDTINRAAVAAPAKETHDRLAREAATGAGGLYALRFGRQNSSGLLALWFAKPAGMTYDVFDRMMRPVGDQNGSLWQRQLCLGPSREFCLLLDADIALPQPLEPLRIERRNI